MKKSRILAGVIVAFGITCLGFGVSRYLVETKVQQPAVLQEGVEDIGTGTMVVEPSDEPEETMLDTEDGNETETEPSASSEDSKGDTSEGGAADESEE